MTSFQSQILHATIIVSNHLEQVTKDNKWHIMWYLVASVVASFM